MRRRPPRAIQSIKSTQAKMTAAE